MDALTVFTACLGVSSVIAGATWLLRTELSDIKIALREHVIEDKAVHLKVIKLEEEKKRRGRR